MTISFLQAGNGDCIHLESGGHHVIIDSGEVCQELVSLVTIIKKSNEKIDLLVITHYDSDHIKAINAILDEMDSVERKDLVKKVWFNATKIGYHGNEKMLSACDATKLADMLIASEIEWKSELEVGDAEKIDDNLTIEVIDGGEIYKPTNEGKLLGNEKNDWGTNLCELEKYLDDDVLDNSKTNAQSVILVAHVNRKSILLPGDAIPEKLSAALERYSISRKGKEVVFDLVKLPHHGSYKNLTQEILNKYECSDYVITTNGAKYYHPDKKMMLKVIKWGRRTNGKKLVFHMNYYDDLFKRLNISEAEKHIFNFECDGKREFKL